METKSVLAAAAIAPIAWGSGYYVTETYLPDRPLFGAAVRALPFGLVLLALRPGLLPRGWWGRTALLGSLNFALFFVLVYVAAERLPGGLAATLTATAPLVTMGYAWLLAGERPRRLSIAAAMVGVAGVALLVLRSTTSVDPLGVVAALGAVLASSLGFVLVKIWRPPVELLTFTAWQLVAGGLVLVPVTLLVEGAPPALDGRNLAGFAFIGVVGTVVAYAVWFRGMRSLSAASVSLVGLLNPVAGTVVGVVLAGESLTGVRLVGLALVLGGVLVGQPAVQDALRCRRTGHINPLAGRIDPPTVGVHGKGGDPRNEFFLDA